MTIALDNPFADEAARIQTPAFECFGTAMVTGHRPTHLSAAEVAWSQVALHHTAWRLRSVYGTQVAISGMALGADTWWALAALASGMRLHAYIPFEAQPAKWPEADREMWRHLRAKAAAEVVIGEGYDVKMLHARNGAMLKATREANGLVVALFKPGTSGGTAGAVDKARKRNQPLLLLNPATQRITREGW